MQSATIADVMWPVTLLFRSPRAIGKAVDELLTPTREKGVRRVAALPALNVGSGRTRQPSRIRGKRNAEVEAAAVASGLDGLSMRPGCHAVNAIGPGAGQIRADEVLRTRGESK